MMQHLQRFSCFPIKHVDCAMVATQLNCKLGVFSTHIIVAISRVDIILPSTPSRMCLIVPFVIKILEAPPDSPTDSHRIVQIHKYPSQQEQCPLVLLRRVVPTTQNVTALRGRVSTPGLSCLM